MMDHWGPEHVGDYVYWNIIVILTNCVHLLLDIAVILGILLTRKSAVFQTLQTVKCSGNN